MQIRKPHSCNGDYDGAIELHVEVIAPVKWSNNIHNLPILPDCALGAAIFTCRLYATQM